MVGDSFHRTVEQFMKNKSEIYDFPDFLETVNTSKPVVNVKVMDHSDFNHVKICILDKTNWLKTLCLHV